MTELETAAVKALAKLRIYPGSSEERFVKEMTRLEKFDWESKLNRGQRQFLWELVIKHKKKIGDSALIQEAESNLLKHYQARLF